MKKKTYTALLSRSGMLRVPKELLPAGVKGFQLHVHPSVKQLRLTPLNVLGNGTGLKRRAIYSNADAKSPQVSIMSALRFLEVKLPKKSAEFPIYRVGDGSLVVEF